MKRWSIIVLCSIGLAGISMLLYMASTALSRHKALDDRHSLARSFVEVDETLRLVSEYEAVKRSTKPASVRAARTREIMRTVWLLDPTLITDYSPEKGPMGMVPDAYRRALAAQISVRHMGMNMKLTEHEKREAREAIFVERRDEKQQADQKRREWEREMMDKYGVSPEELNRISNGQEATSEPSALRLLKVTQWSFVRTTQSTDGEYTYEVSGELRNDSNQDFSDVLLDVALYDKSGRIVATSKVSAANVGSGETGIITGYVIDVTRTKKPAGRIRVASDF